MASCKRPAVLRGGCASESDDEDLGQAHLVSSDEPPFVRQERERVQHRTRVADQRVLRQAAALRGGRQHNRVWGWLGWLAHLRTPSTSAAGLRAMTPQTRAPHERGRVRHPTAPPLRFHAAHGLPGSRPPVHPRLATFIIRALPFLMSVLSPFFSAESEQRVRVALCEDAVAHDEGSAFGLATHPYLSRRCIFELPFAPFQHECDASDCRGDCCDGIPHQTRPRFG